MKRRLNPGATGAQMRLNEARDVSSVIQIYMKTHSNPCSTAAQMKLKEIRNVSTVIQYA